MIELKSSGQECLKMMPFGTEKMKSKTFFMKNCQAQLDVTARFVRICFTLELYGGTILLY